MEKQWVKNNKEDVVSWDVADNEEPKFRFDDEPDKEYFLHRDYYALSEERKKVFDKENPFWKKFFNGDQK